MLLTFIFLISQTNNSEAAYKVLNLEINLNQNSISLKWDNISEKYAIFIKEGSRYTKLWEGRKTTYNYNIDVAETQKLHEFAIVAFDKNNNIMSVSKAYSIPSSNTSKDSPMKNSVAQYSVSNSHIKITWDKIPSTKSFEIYKNGNLLKTTKKNELIDLDIQPNTNYQYEIRGITKVSEEKKNKKISKLKESKIKIRNEIDEKISYEENALIINVKTLKNNLEDNIDIDNDYSTENNNSFKLMTANSLYSASSAYNSLTPQYALVVHGWIPKPLVILPAHIQYQPYIAFHGDTRVNPLPPFKKQSYRVHFAINHMFLSDTSYVNIIANKVGQTIGYKLSGEIVKGNADRDLIIQNMNNNSSFVSYDLDYESGNPLIPYAAPIDYSWTTKIYNDGSYDIIGSHDHTPSISIYIATYPGDSYCNLYFNKSWTGIAFPAGLVNSKNFRVVGSGSDPESSCPNPQY